MILKGILCKNFKWIFPASKTVWMNTLFAALKTRLQDQSLQQPMNEPYEILLSLSVNITISKVSWLVPIHWILNTILIRWRKLQKADDCK